MAKVGEGDQRWIVNDLGDAGTNVNNWHWKELDIGPWCKARLAGLYSSLKIEEPDVMVISFHADKLTIDGDAILNTRKGKLIPSYELACTIPFTCVTDAGVEVLGSIQFPYIAEENHDEDPEIRVVITGKLASSVEEQRIKQVLLTSTRKGHPSLLRPMETLVREIHAGVPAQRQPKAGEGEKLTAVTPAAAPAAAPKALEESVREEEARQAKEMARKKLEQEKMRKADEARGTKRITMTESFYASARDIYECFTVVPRVCAFTRAPATVEPQPGGAFTLFGESVKGTFVELIPGQLIRQKWRFNSWADDVYSDVTIKIHEKEPGNTVVTLTQTEIPEVDKFGNGDTERTVENGWKGMIFERIKAVFGYGI